MGIVLLAFTLGAGQADEGFKPLFNGKDLTGWVPVLSTGKEKNPDKSADPLKTWTIKDGMIICTGKPNGYIRTEKPYQNYILKLEWRYTRPSGLASDEAFKGNSGVLIHMVEPDRVWPKAIEVQLANPSAGSIFPIAPAKSQDRTKVAGKAKPVGEWNTYELICKDGTAELIFNGQNVGKISGCDPKAGYICLQSEGAEIHFRNIQIKELK
jgi:hypothetical protein